MPARAPYVEQYRVNALYATNTELDTRNLKTY